MEFNEKDLMFQNQLKNMRKEELYNMIKCPICLGLYRFAHTLVHCGHTFCQPCIFGYIRSFKGRNPDIKCPQCHSLLDKNYSKSIIKDIYKQSLVDLIQPHHSEEEKIIAKRVQTLFPEFNIQILLEQFKLPSCTKNNYLDQNRGRLKKQSEQKTIFDKLPQKIKQSLGITFQKFAQMIHDQNNFQDFLSIIKQKQADIPKLIQIKPKTQRDLNFVGISNQMKVMNLTVLKLRRYLERKALQKAKQTGQFPKEWISSDSEKLDIKVTLMIGMKELDDNESINELMNRDQGPIIYSVN